MKLYRKSDQIFLKSNVKKNDDVAVTLVWARPNSGVGSEISILSDDKEIGLLDGLHEFDEESRNIASEELSKYYLTPVIKSIIKTDVHLGNRYFTVLTDRGARTFIIKNPYINIRPSSNDGLILRDVIGNMFSIPSLDKLDINSRKKLEKVM